MALEKQLKMIHLLLRRTRSGQLEWRATGDNNAFQAVFSGTSFVLRQISRSGEPDYQGMIVNEEGSVVETFLDTDFRAEDKGREAYTVMRELFELARRKVGGVDKLIDSIIDELNND